MSGKQSTTTNQEEAAQGAARDNVQAQGKAQEKAPQRTQRLYSKECRGGRNFEGDAIDKAVKDGWVNHPGKVK